jgi:malonyl-CoA O-methyltransferase
MADSPIAAARPFDRVATDAALRHLARAPEPPWLHREVARRMGERLEIIRVQPERLIDWWGFLGAGADVLERVYPKARRLVVEPNPALLARGRSAAERPWWTIRGWGRSSPEVVLDTGEIQLRAQLIWANMMLHAVADPPALFEHWEQLLGADGFVMFSCLGPGTLRELRAFYQRLGWSSPTPAFVDMHDLGDMLVQAGFADPVMDQETLTVRWNDPETLLHELRALGRNTNPDRATGLRTPRYRARLVQALDALRSADGSIGLSFEVAYGHAFKAAPRLRADRPTTVSLEDMRAMVRSGKRSTPRG